MWVRVCACACVCGGGSVSVLRSSGSGKNTVKMDLAHPGVHQEGLVGSVHNLGNLSFLHTASTVAKVLHLTLPPDAQKTVHLRILPPLVVHLPLCKYLPACLLVLFLGHEPAYDHEEVVLLVLASMNKKFGNPGNFLFVIHSEYNEVSLP